MPSEQLLSAVAVTAELCGRTFTPAAATVFLDDLARYPEHQVLKALGRCRREVRGVLTVSDVISRLEDGHPGAEEAWSMLPKTEDDSVVWTEEMAEACGVAMPLIQCGDMIAARMAFKESYAKLLAVSRDCGRQPVWSPSFGRSNAGRQSALELAVSAGRLTVEHANRLGVDHIEPEKLRLPAPEVDGERKPMPPHIKEAMLKIGLLVKEIP